MLKNTLIGFLLLALCGNLNAKSCKDQKAQNNIKKVSYDLRLDYSKQLYKNL